MAYKGFFRPTNPQKYRGDTSKIVFRSGYELKFMYNLDTNDKVLWWQSEELRVPYRHPIDNLIHGYWPDIIAEIKQTDGSTKVMMYEIKPAVQCVEPDKPKGKITKKFLKEAVTYSINEQKWKAARAYCENKGWTFQLVTEMDLYGYKMPVKWSRSSGANNPRGLNKGYKYSAEYRQRLSDMRRGKPKSEAWKQSMRGRTLSEEHRLKISKSKIGTKRPDLVKYNQERYLNGGGEDTKQRIREARAKQVMTKEHINKLHEGHRAYYAQRRAQLDG